MCHYRPPTKLREDHVLSCLSIIMSAQGGGVPMWLLPMMHQTWPYKDPLVPLPRTGTPRHVQTCSTWTSLYPLPQTCSNLFIMKYVRLASGRLASYWNAFLKAESWLMTIILPDALVDFCSKFHVYLNFAAILGDTGEVDVEGSFSSSDCEEFSASWASISSSYLSYGTAIISSKQYKQNLADLETMVAKFVLASNSGKWILLPSAT